MPPDETGLLDGICDVLFIGEAPGETEDLRNKPFIGEAGKRLHDLVDASGMQHYGVVYTNAVRCRPPDNKTPTAKQIQYCQHFLLDEIGHYNPRMIIMLGNVPLKAVLGEAGISNWHGAILERDGRIYVPMYHPSFSLHNPSALPMMIDDFEKAYNVLNGSTQSDNVADKYDLYLVDNYGAAFDMYSDIKQAGSCSFDTESNIDVKPFREGCHPIMVSFAIKEQHKAWAVTLSNIAVVDVVKQILLDETIGKKLHNGKYDLLVCIAEWNLYISNIVGDTLLLSYLIDSTPGRHGLKELAGRCLGMYEYAKALDDYHAQHKESDPAKGGDQSLVPVELLAEYAALDAVATLELHDVLYQQLTEQQIVLYHDLLVKSTSALGRMEAAGMTLDRYVVDRYIKVYEIIQQRYYDQLLSLPATQKYIADRNRKLIKEQEQKHNIATSYRRNRMVKPVKPFELNPNSDNQMRDILFGKKYLGLAPTEMTETGMASIKWDNIKCYNDNPFVANLRSYNLLGKMLGTYLRPTERWVGRDGKTHQTYVQDGTVSGRLATRDPNTANIPTPEKEPGTLLAAMPIKNIFTYSHKLNPGLSFDDLTQAILAGKEGCILAADYNGMELRTKASLSNCLGMIEAFAAGKDVHSVVTCKLYHIDDFDAFVKRRKSGDEKAVSLRYHAKWVSWALLFGGGAYTLQCLYGIPEDEANRLVTTYYEMFPEILEDNKQVLSFCRKHGYVDSKFGRRRYFPYINDNNTIKRNASQREAVNHPIQSAASDVLMCALVVIDDQMQKLKHKSKLVNTVYDSLMADVYPGELHDLAALIKSVMEGMTGEWGKKYFPHLDFSWFTVPLVADLEFGHHYGCLEDYHVK